MSQLVENYLHELYLYEELEKIDGGFLAWAKRQKEVKVKKLGSKLQTAFELRDTTKMKKLLSIIPTPSFDTLEKMAKRIMGLSKYTKINKEARKQIGQKFADLPGAEERLLSFILTIMNNNVDDFVEGISKKIKKLRELRKNPKVKKIAGAEATLGMVLIVGAGSIAIAAIATFSLPALIIALLISGVALAFTMEGVKH